ncbi:hypothetical protein LguiA_021450 [Lonicera macranthoides]
MTKNLFFYRRNILNDDYIEQGLLKLRHSRGRRAEKEDSSDNSTTIESSDKDTQSQVQRSSTKLNKRKYEKHKLNEAQTNKAKTPKELGRIDENGEGLSKLAPIDIIKDDSLNSDSDDDHSLAHSVIVEGLKIRTGISPRNMAEMGVSPKANEHPIFNYAIFDRQELKARLQQDLERFNAWMIIKEMMQKVSEVGIGGSTPHGKKKRASFGNDD